MTRVTTLLLACVLLTSAAGCIGEADLLAARDRAAQLSAALGEREAGLSERFGEATTEAQRLQIEEDLAIIRAQRTALDAATAQVDAAAARAADPQDPLGSLVSAMAPWLPAEARLPLLLGAGLAASVVRLVRLKRAAESIVDSVEKAGRQDPGLRDRLAANADTLRSVQTAAAATLVDRRQRRAA
jgi:hypothetical protein